MGSCRYRLMGCCKVCSTRTARVIFISLNGLIILFSIVLVIYNLLVTTASFASSWLSSFAAIIGISTSAIQTFLVLSTLLVSFFSGIAAFGMEAANFRDEWDNSIFHVCCCNLLKTKMAIYVLITMVFGLGLLDGCWEK